MDAKSKANFINSVAGGQEIPCPDCNTLNKADSKFCISCGKSLIASEANDTPAFAPVQESAPAFAPVQDDAPAFAAAEEPAFAPAEPVKQAKTAPQYEEPMSVFAQGLPEWSIEPPQVMVRRR